MIIIYNKHALNTGSSNVEDLKKLLQVMEYAVKKWHDEGKPNSGDFA